MKYLFALFLLSLATAGFSQTQNPNPWVQSADPTAEITYRNPIIPGFYSDPTICRVGEDYYLSTSTFEYFPGMPILHSRDLVNWQQIGHGIHYAGQCEDGLNIFASTFRYHEGTFYLITTNVGHGGNFFITATKPHGPWSEPIWIDVGGIDPDLFFDDDGRAYVISSTFELTEIDLTTGQLLGEKRKVWNGTGGRYPEAPHLYKKDGFYYLMASEGGTEEAHMVTIARSHSIWGPYIDNPANPIVAHANVAGMGQPIQGTGHGDLIQAHDGNWWMVVHGYRSVAGYPPHHTLGRETCLVPVSWPTGGWPVVNGNGSVPVNMTHPTLPLQPFPPPYSYNFSNFDEPLSLEWNYVFPFEEENYHIDPVREQLILTGNAVRLGEEGRPTFVGRRLTDINFSATTFLDYDPATGQEEAGMTLLNNGSHFDLMVTKVQGQRSVQVVLQFGQTEYRSEPQPLVPGPVTLRIEGTGHEFLFSFSQNEEEFQLIEKADARFLSTETVGWFTGVYVGLYATGNGQPSQATAHYQWFDYQPPTSGGQK